MQVLGDGSAFLVTDVTRGRQGNNERLAFVFDRQRVRPSGLACELVVAAENAGIPEETSRASSPHPYAVSFACDLSAFTLVILHVVYGQGPQDRVAELQEIAGWLARWASQGDAWGTNLIALGDFNIDRTDDPLYQAVIGTGRRPPAGLNLVPRTILKTRIQPPHPSADTSTIRLPGLLTARCPGPVIAVRQRWHVQLRRRPGTSHQRDAAFLVDLGPLPAMGRIPPAALIGGPPVMPKLGQGCVLVSLCNR
jgi:hypothetical protein